MRVLLDTGIVLRGEARFSEYCKIKRLYRWMDRAGILRVAHPSPLRALLSRRADIFVTEDARLFREAEYLGLESRVLSVEQFVRTAAAKALGRADLPEPEIISQHFCDIDISEPIFSSLKRDYPGFEAWFSRKSAQTAYVCRDYDGELMGFLYMKTEDEYEDYSDITPALEPARRLKIGTLKVSCAGLGLGGRYMRLAFDAAARQGARQVYTTLFKGRRELDSLAHFLSKWGFERCGAKLGAGGEESVMLKRLDAP